MALPPPPPPVLSAVPREMLQEILRRLPTEDVARCCCVCRLWRGVARDDSFRHLHHAARYVAGRDQPLLVSEKCEPGGCAEATVFRASSGRAICGVANPPGYRVANVCNGFLCFSRGGAPVVVCNPVTGHKMELPKAPPLAGGRAQRHLFALGFSRSTNEYKLFRLSSSSAPAHYSFPPPTTTTTGSSSSSTTTDASSVDVCTLGGRRGWRQHPYLFPHRPVDHDGASPPVLVDGMLYVVTCRGDRDERPDRILQIDVAGEAHCTYRLPDFEDPVDDVRVSLLELSGQLCLAVNTVHWIRPKLVFWVMAAAAGNDDDDGQGQQPYYYWHPRYSFDLDVDLTSGDLQYDRYSRLPRGAWLDDDEVLCYRVGDTLYQYDTEGLRCSSPCSGHAGVLPWDEQQQLRLPSATDQSPSTDRSWSVCGGYRPTLLSPLVFALPPSLHAQEQSSDQVLLRALRSDKLKRRRRSSPAGRRADCNQRAAKRRIAS